MEWKIISGYPNYKISNKGMVLSIKRTTSDNRRIKKRNLKPLLNNKYYSVALYRSNCKVKLVRIHRLVAQEFVLNPKNKPYVNHIDGNKFNNNAENLEWVTHQENMNHAVLNNLTPRKYNLTDIQLLTIFTYNTQKSESRKHGYTKYLKQLSENYKIPMTTLYGIKNGHRISELYNRIFK